MKVINVKNKNAEILFSKDEFGILRNTSIHVLHEFAMGKKYDFTKSTGWQKEEAKNFSEKIRIVADGSNGDDIAYTFAKEELLYLITVITDTTKKMNTEFQTITGYYIKDAIDVRNNLQEIIGKVVAGG